MRKLSQQIPADLVDQLEEGVHRLLAHPSRRQILRALTAEGQRMSIVQLEPFTCASCSFASTSYHAKRLEESHLIAQVGLEAAEDTLTPYYMSLIDDNRPVLRVLQATEASDNSS